MNPTQKKIMLNNCDKHSLKFSQTLSHYTSQNVLFNILEKKQFWLGNTKSMNDKTELSHFIDDLEKGVIEDCGKDSREKAQVLFFNIHKRLEGEYPYAMCLSSAKDDAAQWERYADNAKGVCLVFDTKKLLQLIYGSDLYLSSVFYDNDIKEHQHYNYVMNYLIGNDYGFQNETGLIDNIIATAASYKHKSFIAENESRICSLMLRCNKFCSKELKKLNNIVKSVMIINISELEKENEIMFGDVIEKIYIGPRSNQSIEDLSKYLKQIGFENLQSKIERSKCPLR